MDEVVEVPKKRKGVSGPLEKAFNNNAREQLDCEIARMFYTGGLSFNLAKNPHYIRSYNRAASCPIPGYRPPGYNALRTTLLHKERMHIEKMLEPIKLSWQQKGVSVCSDGWSDSQRRPLINVMAACESGPMFLRAVNCEGDLKDRFFISDLLIDSILEIGPQHVVQVITDNASNCKAAGAIINARFPHIFWTPCVVHTLNLALKNICTPSSITSNKVAYDACNWISQVAEDVWFIKNFIMNHGMRLAMFNEHSHLKVLSIADTRFASIVVMLKRFRKIKQSLERMVISDQWEAYRDDDVTKARAVKDMILDDDAWAKIDYILAFTLPIYEMLRRLGVIRMSHVFTRFMSGGML
ncbi:putative ribonuclease H-like domain-containing protein [Rosa chinensis]|uniref:Putative ribonuclease H-like domain-containing protein n=2 Tax=Rosa chinensis TaxID=74649 RepID=A0A2P6P8Z7_ROSCH|nr:putative ribonuclease H-like domain-containing protein [Rosa chinensis]